VSMLVDTLAHPKPESATESTVLGPFHVPGAPELPFGANISKGRSGEPTLVTGRVLGIDGTPIANAKLDVWQASAEGFYDVQETERFPDMNLRGIFYTDSQGQFGFCTEKPASYPVPTDGPVGVMLKALGRPAMRPAHIHFMVSAEQHQPLTTHLFVRGDPYLNSDAVQAVKDSLIVDFKQLDDPVEAKAMGQRGLQAGDTRTDDQRVDFDAFRHIAATTFSISAISLRNASRHTVQMVVSFRRELSIPSSSIFS